MIAVRKSIGLKYQSRQLATPGHVIFAYNIVQRCLSLLVWLLGVDYVLCTPCTAGSKRHRLSGSLLWVYVTISIFRGVGLSFHAFNESRPPWLAYTAFTRRWYGTERLSMARYGTVIEQRLHAFVAMWYRMVFKKQFRN